MTKLMAKAMHLVLSMLTSEPSSEEGAIRQILENGGVVVQDHRLPGAPVTEVVLTYCERSLFKIRFFPRLTSLKCMGVPIFDEQLAEIAKHPSLKRVQFVGAMVTEPAVERLQKARPNLQIVAGNRNTTERRIRQHFKLHANVKITEEAVRAAILKDISAGSSVEAVQNYLEKNGIGKDKHSLFTPLEDGRIECYVGQDFESLQPFLEEIAITFLFDREGKLQTADVKHIIGDPFELRNRSRE